MWPRNCRWLLCVATLIHLPAVAACHVTEKALLGAWQSVTEQGFFEVFELRTKHRFDSWRHDRPELIGARWQLNQCELTIQDGTPYVFRYRVKLNRNQLILMDMQQSKSTENLFQRVAE